MLKIVIISFNQGFLGRPDFWYLKQNLKLGLRKITNKVEKYLLHLKFIGGGMILLFGIRIVYFVLGLICV